MFQFLFNYLNLLIWAVVDPFWAKINQIWHAHQLLHIISWCSCQHLCYGEVPVYRLAICNRNVKENSFILRLFKALKAWIKIVPGPSQMFTYQWYADVECRMSVSWMLWPAFTPCVTGSNWPALSPNPWLPASSGLPQVSHQPPLTHTSADT